MKQIVVNLLKNILKNKGIKLSDEELERYIEIPPSSEMGDYAFPCFFIAKELKQDPHQIALEIREKIGEPSLDFEDIQTSGGYINFFLDRKDFARKLLKEILKKKENFGKFDIGNGKKALIEHTSTNPNAPPHVGRARNAIIGDSIVKILSFLNFKPEVHYYVNDVSKQIAMLVMGDADKLEFKDMLKRYIKISKNAEEFQDQIFFLLRQFEDGDKKTVAKFNRITKTCLKGQKDIFSELGINYDVFDYESDYIKKSKKILIELEKTKKLHKDKEGRLYLDQKNTPLKKMMKSPVLILTRSDGTGLYPLRDIVYTIDKMKSSKENIIVLGEDQKLYFLQLKEALNILNQQAPKVVHYSFILLNKKGKSKKMSTRKGSVILLETFLKDAFNKAKNKKIGIAAVKYSILKNSPNKMILFNLQDSLQFEGDTGPYLLYSYARASSILKKVKTQKNKKSFVIMDLSKNEIDLVKKLSQFPEVVLNSYNNLNPSLIANYSYQLAQVFNEFYHGSKVIGSKEESFRASLVEAFRYVLKNSLNLLGIETLEKM